jgi:hypothetical protein
MNILARRRDYEHTFTASGSEILFVSTQLVGLLSSGSSISLGGLTAGVKSSRRLPERWLSPLKSTSYVLSGLDTTCQFQLCMDIGRPLLDDESVEVGILSKSGLWRNR